MLDIRKALGRMVTPSIKGSKGGQREADMYYEPPGILTELLRMGISTYKIKKHLGVTWQTVYFWRKGVFYPNDENMEKLRHFYLDICAEKGVECFSPGRMEVRRTKKEPKVF